MKLSSPTPIINDATFQDPFAYDDAQAFVLLPFGITLYGLTSSNVTVTTNGVSFANMLDWTDRSNIFIQLFTTSFDTDNEDGDYQPYSLPTLQAPGTTAFPFWFDQVAYGPSTVNGTTDEGIYYQYEFNQTSNTYKLYVEYLLSDYEHDSNPGATPPPLYQYIVQYDSSLAGQMSFYYFQNGNTGTNATIGIQGASSAGGELLTWAPMKSMHTNNAVAVATVTYSDGASGSVAPGYLINFDTREGNGTVAQTTFSYQSYPAGTFPEGLC